MEIQAPVPEAVINLTDGKRKIPVRLRTREECRELIRAAALAALILPDDDGPPVCDILESEWCKDRSAEGLVCTEPRNHLTGHAASLPDGTVARSWPRGEWTEYVCTGCGATFSALPFTRSPHTCAPDVPPMGAHPYPEDGGFPTAREIAATEQSAAAGIAEAARGEELVVIVEADTRRVLTRPMTERQSVTWMMLHREEGALQAVTTSSTEYLAHLESTRPVAVAPPSGEEVARRAAACQFHGGAVPDDPGCPLCIADPAEASRS